MNISETISSYSNASVNVWKFLAFLKTVLLKGVHGELTIKITDGNIDYWHFKRTYKPDDIK